MNWASHRYTSNCYSKGKHCSSDLQTVPGRVLVLAQEKHRDSTTLHRHEHILLGLIERAKVWPPRPWTPWA